MISRPFLFLVAISLYSATTVSAAEGGLRKEGLQVAQKELICQLATLHTTYMSNDNQITHEEQTTCNLVDNGVPTPFSYPIILPNHFFEQHKSKIELGQVLASIRGASLVAGEYVIEDDYEITVLDGNYSPRNTGRKLLDQKDPRDAFGERRLIAFRVNGVAGEKQVVNSVSEIHRALFDSGISVKTQYEKCSIDQFTWVSEGVHEIYLPKALSSYKGALEARNAAYEVIKNSATYKASYGSMDVKDVAHNIMFCMPPIPTWKGFIANAQSGGAISTFSDKWCADLSTVVHELGHNLGRGHAGRNNNPYADPSSNMGGGGNMASPIGPQKCFNAAQHIEFGWYKDHILNFNPKVDGSRMIKLASFVDVRKAGAANVEPVIIKIGKYNIQYNQAKDYNIGAGMANRVTIVTDTDYGVTWVQAELRPEDQQFTFSDSGKTVFVNYCEAVTGTTNTPDAVYIGIGIGGSACTTIPTVPVSPPPPPPIPSPTPHPTPFPTPLPTPSPSTPRPIPSTPSPTGLIPPTPPPTGPPPPPIPSPTPHPTPFPTPLPTPSPSTPRPIPPTPSPTGFIPPTPPPTGLIPPTPSPTGFIPPTPPPSGLPVSNPPPVAEVPDQDEDEDDGAVDCNVSPDGRVRFTLDDTPDGQQESIRCRNMISVYGSSVCSLTARRRNYEAWPDERQIKDICQEECALAGNGMCDPILDTIAPTICENKPRRAVYYGDNQKTHCVFVNNADLCNQDALNKHFEPLGYKIYHLCQHQCAEQAQCEAI